MGYTLVASDQLIPNQLWNDQDDTFIFGVYKTGS